MDSGMPHAREKAAESLQQQAYDRLEEMIVTMELPAGAAVFRDNRAWHSGTPNLSNEVRCMPNIEYYAPWFRSEAVNRCMPHDLWAGLGEHGQRICRYVVCDPGEPVIGAGFTHPRAAARDAFIAEQLAGLGALGDPVRDREDRLEPLIPFRKHCGQQAFGESRVVVE